MEVYSYKEPHLSFFRPNKSIQIRLVILAARRILRGLPSKSRDSISHLLTGTNYDTPVSGSPKKWKISSANKIAPTPGKDRNVENGKSTQCARKIICVDPVDDSVNE